MSKKCTTCNQKLKSVFEHIPFSQQKLLQIDSGISFIIHGGYGEFFDSPFEKDGYEEPSEFNLCHDCSVKVFEILDPKLRFKGGHPTINEDGSKCCKWAWTKEEVELESKAI